MWWIVAGVVLAGVVLAGVMIVSFAIDLYRRSRALLAQLAITTGHLGTAVDLLAQVRFDGRQVDRTDVG